GRDVGVLGDHVELAVHLDGHAGAQIGRLHSGGSCRFGCFWERSKSSDPARKRDPPPPVSRRVRPASAPPPRPAPPDRRRTRWPAAPAPPPPGPSAPPRRAPPEPGAPSPSARGPSAAATPAPAPSRSAPVPKPAGRRLPPKTQKTCSFGTPFPTNRPHGTTSIHRYKIAL